MNENPTPNEERRAPDSDNNAATGETSLGINENMAGLLTYFALWATGTAAERYAPMPGSDALKPYQPALAALSAAPT